MANDELKRKIIEEHTDEILERKFKRRARELDLVQEMIRGLIDEGESGQMEDGQYWLHAHVMIPVAVELAKSHSEYRDWVKIEADTNGEEFVQVPSGK